MLLYACVKSIPTTTNYQRQNIYEVRAMNCTENEKIPNCEHRKSSRWETWTDYTNDPTEVISWLKQCL